ncbi:hypothetical protein Acsp01_13200 [Actinoplanes sp. NBRC 101535]|nr:hypothetical protein Acsp01_13200 [Actinoplanes sp. NBRC 101535]
MTPGDAWAFTARHAAETTFFFDFDGVLSPVTDDPDASQPVPGAVDVLERLGGVVSRVAIVSARPVDFLRSRFGALEHVDLYGLYGLEVWHDGQVVTEPTALEYVETMRELAERARVELGEPVLVEYKRIAVALHYRLDPSRADDVKRWAHDQAERQELRIQNGRMVVELKPPVQQDKGMVIAEAVRGTRCAWYFGDDMSDIKAFTALHDHEAGDPSFLGMAVAVANPETGAEVSRAADLTLDSPETVAAFLTEGLDRLR